jgi:hypothetical protein
MAFSRPARAPRRAAGGGRTGGGHEQARDEPSRAVRRMQSWSGPGFGRRLYGKAPRESPVARRLRRLGLRAYKAV